MTSITPAAATARFTVLSGLRWLPDGVLVTAFVLLMQARGHSLATVGIIFALHGAVVVMLELPTGGLADVLSRRRVLLAASMLAAAGALVTAVAQPVWQFALAAVLLGAGRALASGPLEAWYVDTVHLTAPTADLRPGLSRGGVGTYVGLTVGALLGAGLAAAGPGSAPQDAPWVWLSWPMLLTAALWCLHGLAVLLLVCEADRTPSRPGALLRSAVVTVRAGVQLTARAPLLRAVLLLAAAGGITAATVETIMPGRLAAMLGDPERGAMFYGLLLAAAYVGASLGSAFAPRLARLAGSSTAGIVAGVWVAAGCVAALSFGRLPVLAACYLLQGVALAAVAPLQSSLVHAATSSATRATALSVQSLSLQVGAILGSLTLPFVASRVGPAAAWATAAILLALAAAPLLRRSSDIG